MAMKRREGPGRANRLLWEDNTFSQEYPALYAWLRENTWDDGKPRKTGTVTISTDGWVIKACMHDRDARRACWVSGDTFADLLAAMEMIADSEDGDWRPDKR